MGLVTPGLGRFHGSFALLRTSKTFAFVADPSAPPSPSAKKERPKKDGEIESDSATGAHRSMSFLQPSCFQNKKRLTGDLVNLQVIV